MAQVMRSGMLRTTLSGLRGSPSSGFGHGANSLTRSVALAVKISDSRYRFSGMNMLKSEDTVKVPSNWSFEQVRWYQRPPERPGLLKRIIDNIREGIQRDKEMQENIKKFQEEAKRMEQSETVKTAKDKMSTIAKFKENIEPYRSKVSEVFKSSSEAVSSTVGKAYEDAKSSEVFKKTQEIKEEFSKSAQDAAEKLSKQSEEIEKTEAFKNVSKAYKSVKSDLFDDIAEASKPYERPEELRRRTQPGSKLEETEEEKVLEANTEATGMVLHRESKWSQQWKDFKDNNPVVNKDVFSQSETAAAMAEITKIDPNFNKDKFILECERQIIPTVLEAFIRGDLEVLQDWCHEAAFNILSTQIKHNMATGTKVDSKILDIRDVDLAMAKVMEQGPVLILTFTAQQTMVLRDSSGKVVEGKEDNIENVTYIWAMCRDQTIYDPKAAWRVLEFGVQQTTPWL